VNEEQPGSQQARRRRFYDEEFKRNAVELLERGGHSAVQLSRELGISDCSLGKSRRHRQHEDEDEGRGRLEETKARSDAIDASLEIRVRPA
jgi:transposase-like protein